MSDQADHTPDRIDAALRDRFAPPPLERLAVGVAVAAERRAARGRLLLVACVAAVVGAGAMFTAVRVSAPAALAPVPIAPVTPAVDACPPLAVELTSARCAETFANALASGFDTGACCAGPVSMKTLCQKVYAAGIDIDPTAGIVICGTYSGGALGHCTGFLARVDGAPVCVFVCPREADPKLDARDFTDLRLHRRDIGALVVYELSRASEPRVLPHLIMP